MPQAHQQCRLLLPALKVAEALAVAVAVADIAPDAVFFFFFFLGYRGIVHPLPDGKGTERT